ncbi:hypothetical protein JVU11DRAFT_12679 [Chiua virens]|nr:hypothetical protein JVU11DRAFT_12679 [Chiua virens]
MENRRTPDEDLRYLNDTGVPRSTHRSISNLHQSSAQLVSSHSTSASISHTHPSFAQPHFVQRHPHPSSTGHPHQAQQTPFYPPSTVISDPLTNSSSTSPPSSSMIVSGLSFYYPSPADTIPDYQHPDGWDAPFDPSFSDTMYNNASISRDSALHPTSAANLGSVSISSDDPQFLHSTPGFGPHRSQHQGMQQRQISPTSRRQRNSHHRHPAEAHGQLENPPHSAQGPVNHERTMQSQSQEHRQPPQELASQRLQELLSSLPESYTHLPPQQSTSQEHTSTSSTSQDQLNTANSAAIDQQIPLGASPPFSATSNYPAQSHPYSRTSEQYYSSSADSVANVGITVEHAEGPPRIVYNVQATHSLSSLHDVYRSASGPYQQRHGHSSPHSSLSRFTPPTHPNTPASDPGPGGHSAASPAGSYGSHPGTNTSSVDDGSGSGWTSGISSGMVGSESSRVGRMTESGSLGARYPAEVGSGGNLPAQQRNLVQAPRQSVMVGERSAGQARSASHAHSTSLSTVIGSPPGESSSPVGVFPRTDSGRSASYHTHTSFGVQLLDGYAQQHQQPHPQALAHLHVPSQEQYQYETPSTLYATPASAITNTQVQSNNQSMLHPVATPQRQGQTAVPAARAPLVRTSTKRPRPPKRARQHTSIPPSRSNPVGSDSESDDDDIEWIPGPDDGGGTSAGINEPGGTGGAGQVVPPGGRKIGACSYCKRLKMKCDFPEGATSCKRCTSTGHPCIVEAKKPRNTPNKREYLLAQIRHKDQIIGSLLKQLHNPYMATPLAIDQFKLAISPSDKDNVRVVDWMDRLQGSTQKPDQMSTARTQIIREMRRAGELAPSVLSTGGRPSVSHTMDDSDNVIEDPEEANTEEEDTEKVHSALPDVTVPLGLLANLSLDKENGKDKGKGKSRARPGSTGAGSGGKPEEDDDNVGVANKEYFKPGPANDLNIRKHLIERNSPPDILLHGLVTSADVDKLFDIFWKQINPFIGLLDPKLHNSTSIFQRCPFLFTVICAISSRYYGEKSEIYPVAMHFARHSAANALIDGWKSVELCQAYILMSIYAVPARRWEEDRSWLYTGLAIRIATDLNLHQVSMTQPQTERQEREMLNRTRVWMICFNLDRSTATQFGKPTTIKDDYITRNSADWYRRFQFRDKYDIHLCAYSQLLRIVGRFHETIFSDPSSPTGLDRSLDFLTVTRRHDAHLTTYFEEWKQRFESESDPNDSGCRFRCTLLPFLVNYSRLVMYSFGFQNAFQRGVEASDNFFLTKCFEAATAVIKHMVNVLAPSGLMRSSPDGHFIFASFASAFLLKLLRPEFVHILTQEMENEIFDLIGRLITTLQEVAIDERHTPRLYARFLESLLMKHRRGGSSIAGRMQPLPPASQRAVQPPSHSYMAARDPSSSHAPHAAQHGSHPRQDSDSMQLALNSFQNGIETPSTGATATHPLDAPSFVPAAHDAVSEPLESDVSMADVLADSGTLATMHALNDVWWGNMMMPGFSWPDAPLMGSLHDERTIGAIPGIHPVYGVFQGSEAQLAT